MSRHSEIAVGATFPEDFRKNFLNLSGSSMTQCSRADAKHRVRLERQRRSAYHLPENGGGGRRQSKGMD